MPDQTPVGAQRPTPRKVMQLGDELLVDGGNGLWYPLREAVSGGRFIDELAHPGVDLLGPIAAANAEIAQLKALLDEVRDHVGGHDDGEIDAYCLRELLAGRKCAR